MLKECSRCEDDKEYPDEFHYRKSTGKHYKYCKDCHRASMKEHYRNNKKYYKTKARKNDEAAVRKVYEWLYCYFKDHPCIDCGETNPIKLEFDHINDDKEANVSTLVHNRSIEKVKKEVAKCEVRCANCHKLVTAVRANWYWIAFLKEVDVALSFNG